MLAISSRQILKSFPPPLERSPLTFSKIIYLGFLALMILIASKNSPLREPLIPFRFQACERSYDEGLFSMGQSKQVMDAIDYLKK